MYLEATRPGSYNHVLEIDDVLLDVARDELGFVTGPDMEVTIGDARLSVDDFADDSFDVVVGDAFGGQSVPWHLTTTEFIAKIDRVLRDDGDLRDERHRRRREPVRRVGGAPRCSTTSTSSR